MVSNLANKQKLATANWPVYGQRNFEIPKRAIKKSNKIYVSPVCIKYINTKCQTMPARAKMVANYTAQKNGVCPKRNRSKPRANASCSCSCSPTHSPKDPHEQIDTRGRNENSNGHFSSRLPSTLSYASAFSLAADRRAVENLTSELQSMPH